MIEFILKMKTKIAFFEIEPWEEDYLKPKLTEFEPLFFEGKLEPQNLKQITDVNILSPFIYSKIDKSVISSLSSLKYIATRSTGFDHVDLVAAEQKGVLVSNVPTYGENTVAEHTFALILALSRKIYPSLEQTKKGDFSLDNLRGFDLSGKTIGIVGIGSIGRHVARIAKGFQMNVLVYDVHEDSVLAKKMGFRFASLEDLFGNSDIVTLHLPYNKNTHHLINLKTLKMFKKGCYLINTARGGVCDTTALLKGLKDGVFAGLGLDVLEEEALIREERELLTSIFERKCDLKILLEDHILLKQPNVLVTPHNAFNSAEALTRILDTTIENIKGFAKGKPVNLVGQK